MKKPELDKYAETLIIMSADYLAENISLGTFKSNLSMINANINPTDSLKVRMSTLLDEALDIERCGVLTPRSTKLAWAGRLRGKAARINEQIAATLNAP